MPPDASYIVGNQDPKPRIVQYANRRYSIRLEPVFWLMLERLAEHRQMRLGRLVAELEEAYDGRNFASHLRVMCMIEAERALAAASLQSGAQGNVLDLVDACPSPGLVLSRYRTILAVNDAFADWLGGREKAPTGSDLTSIVQVRTRRPLNEVWLDLVVGKLNGVEANVLLVEPGRAVAATGRLVALHPAGGREFYAVLWLALAKRPLSTSASTAAATPPSPREATP